ncbi:hypothetical protein BV25DRAFT_1870945 [Artomyces pyxidatus]|uniref:Uncharacterized protein n=1 Tax=Artomyces pyxidatus TaxID=48021 RepID=A0ACB8SXP2_9AGAM|nr:hypothetical protein BV25DRAFT_1870945 [Artomyces pyxidatus]
MSPGPLPSPGSSADMRKGKSGLSCAECRRVFPCQSCIRRGCSAICPDGTLAATKGNKILMAHAQRLTEQVKTMNARILELEAALKNTQGSGESHPLLRDSGGQDPLADISDLEAKFEADLEQVSDTIGSLSITWDGKTKYYGETAGAEEGEIHDRMRNRDSQRLGLPFEILELVHAFPFGLLDHSCTKTDFLHYIPSRERAIELTNLYYVNAAWMYDPCPRGEFERIVLEPIYEPTEGLAPLASLHAHNLSMFFMALASGATFEVDRSDILSEQYHALAWANCASAQALFMMIHYLYLSARFDNERRWLLSGICARVAQMVCVSVLSTFPSAHTQRDSAGWNLDRDEVQRRRTMFWEYYTWDTWSSVVNGRPPSLNLGHSDCRFPDDLDPFVKAPDSLELGWHAWKFRYSAACLSIAVQRAFTVQPMTYASLLVLDKRIRTFPIPSHLQSPGQDSGKPWNTDPTRAMQQCCVVCECESSLLYIHRTYFAQAIREASDPLKHPYAQSVLAAYRSALVLITTIKSLYTVHPRMTSRVWFFWSGYYASCLLLSAIVIESPGCVLAQRALTEFDSARAVYQEGSAACRPAPTIPMLDRLQSRAHTSFKAYQDGLKTGQHVQPRKSADPSTPDEVTARGVRKSVVNKSVINKSSSTSPHHSAASSPGSQRHSQTPEAEPLTSQPTTQTPVSGVGNAHPPGIYQQPSPPAPSPDAFVIPMNAPTSTVSQEEQYSTSSLSFASYLNVAMAQSSGQMIGGALFNPLAPAQNFPMSTIDTPYQAGESYQAFLNMNQGFDDMHDDTFASLGTLADLDAYIQESPVRQTGQQQYRYFPQMSTDVVMTAATTNNPPIPLNQEEIWWKFVQDLGMAS